MSRWPPPRAGSERRSRERWPLRRLFGAQLMGYLDDRRPEEHDEQRREDAADHREEHLQRRLLTLLLGTLTALSADLLRLDAEHVGDADAELLRLDDRLH